MRRVGPASARDEHDALQLAADRARRQLLRHRVRRSARPDPRSRVLQVGRCHGCTGHGAREHCAGQGPGSGHVLGSLSRGRRQSLPECNMLPLAGPISARDCRVLACATSGVAARRSDACDDASFRPAPWGRAFAHDWSLPFRWAKLAAPGSRGRGCGGGGLWALTTAALQSVEKPIASKRSCISRCSPHAPRPGAPRHVPRPPRDPARAVRCTLVPALASRARAASPRPPAR